VWRGDNEKPTKKSQERELGKDRWYSQMGQVGCNRIAARPWWWETGHYRVQRVLHTWQTD